MLKTDLVEHSTFKDFYQHPGYPHLYVSREGAVFNQENGSFSRMRTFGNYRTFDNKPVHGLVAETFLEIPEGLTRQEVIPNHKNGLKWDCRVSNLEWTTSQGNVQHAYEAGLRTDNNPVLVKDLYTGEIQRFYSLQACARHFNVNGFRIHYYLKPENIGKAWFGHYLLIREGMEWPEVGPEVLNHSKPGLPKDTVVYDKIDEVWLIFTGVGEAALHTDIKTGTITSGIQRAKDKGKIWYETSRWNFCYLSDHLGALPKDPVRIERSIKMYDNSVPLRQPIPVQVENLDTGEVKGYPSSEALAVELGVKKNTLQKHLWCNQGVWKQTLKVTYLDPIRPPSP
jgi:hypothetical protein